MVTSEVCDNNCGRQAERAVECPAHGRHYYCRYCNKVAEKAGELFEAIKEDIEDWEENDER